MPQKTCRVARSMGTRTHEFRTLHKKNIEPMTVWVGKNKTIVPFTKFFWFGNNFPACVLNLFRPLIYLNLCFQRRE